jgi:hypothetical protein
MKMNDNLVLISGKSATGKSASLMNIADPEGVIYLNCENNKKLPFRGKFKEFGITDPVQVYQAFEEAEKMDDVHTIVVDSLTYMMDMYESYYVLNSSNTMKAWGDYAQFFKKLMSKYVAESTKNVIFIAHTTDIMNDAEMAMETLVKVKGSLMNQGIESYFSTVVSTKKVNLKSLKKYESDLLEITPDEEELGFKYVFQTRITKDTVNERMRAPLSMWTTNESFTDNNIQLVIDRLHEYYV